MSDLPILQERIVFIGASWTSIMPGAQATALSCRELVNGRFGRHLYAAVRPERPLMPSETTQCDFDYTSESFIAARREIFCDNDPELVRKMEEEDPYEDCPEMHPDYISENGYVAYERPIWGPGSFDGLPTLREIEDHFLDFMNNAVIVGEWSHAILADLAASADFDKLLHGRVLCTKNLILRLAPSRRFDDLLRPQAQQSEEDVFLAYFSALRDHFLSIVKLAATQQDQVPTYLTVRVLQYARVNDIDDKLQRQRATEVLAGLSDADVDAAIQNTRDRLLSDVENSPFLISDLYRKIDRAMNIVRQNH